MGAAVETPFGKATFQPPTPTASCFAMRDCAANASARLSAPTEALGIRVRPR